MAKSVHLSKISEVISAVISEDGHTLKLKDNLGTTKFDILDNEIVYITEESITFDGKV